jgi:hypothetical protein
MNMAKTLDQAVEEVMSLPFMPRRPDLGPPLPTFLGINWPEPSKIKVPTLTLPKSPWRKDIEKPMTPPVLIEE